MYKGQVQYVNPKNEWGKYSFRLLDDEMYYNTLKDPASLKGKVVSFEGTQRGTRSVEVDEESLEIAEDSAPITNANVRKFVPRRGAARATSSGLTKDQFWENKEKRDVEKDRRIELQSCRNSATAFVDLLFKLGAVDLTKIKVAAKVEFIEKLVAHYQEQFVAENNNLQTTSTSAPAAESEAVEAEGDWN